MQKPNWPRQKAGSLNLVLASKILDMIVSKKLAILLIIEVFVALLPALFYFVLGMFLLPDLVNKIISDYDYGALLFVIMFLAGLFGLIGFYYLALFVLLEPNMGKKESSPGLVTQCYMS